MKRWRWHNKREVLEAVERGLLAGSKLKDIACAIGITYQRLWQIRMECGHKDFVVEKTAQS
jgi:hypothetical protein